MAKNEDLLKLTGTVVDVMPSAMFRVELENGHKITATLAGKLRQHNIRILLGDGVEVEMSPYDLSRGRIVYRNK